MLENSENNGVCATSLRCNVAKIRVALMHKNDIKKSPLGYMFHMPYSTPNQEQDITSELTQNKASISARSIATQLYHQMIASDRLALALIIKAIFLDQRAYSAPPVQQKF